MGTHLHFSASPLFISALSPKKLLSHILGIAALCLVILSSSGCAATRSELHFQTEGTIPAQFCEMSKGASGRALKTTVQCESSLFSSANCEDAERFKTKITQRQEAGDLFAKRLEFISGQNNEDIKVVIDESRRAIFFPFVIAWEPLQYVCGIFTLATVGLVPCVEYGQTSMEIKVTFPSTNQATMLTQNYDYTQGLGFGWLSLVLGWDEIHSGASTTGSGLPYPLETEFLKNLSTTINSSCP